MSETTGVQELSSGSADVLNKRSFDKILRQILSIRELGPLILLVIQVSFFALYDPGFYSTLNINNILWFVPELGIIALGMTLLLTSGEFDLSVGAVFSLSQNTMFYLFIQDNITWEIGFAVALLLCALVGLLNGLFVTKLGISSFLVTLGMMLIVRGSVLYFTDATSQSMTSSVIDTPLKGILVGVINIGDFKLYGSLIWWLGLAAVLYFVLNETSFGNWIMATGGNPQAAQARGTNTNQVKILMFILTALLAGFAGCISSLRLSTAYPVAGDGYELEVIAMTVIGGTLLSGGRGTIVGSIIGTLILRTMRNGIIFVGIPGLAYNIAIGLIILLMMTTHTIVERSARLGDRS
jgi:simple sugar transport system permease protein